MSFLNSLLGSVKWWIKIIITVITSLISTTLPLPIPLADISFVATIQAFKSIYWYSIIILIITLTDTIFAVITYNLGNKLTHRFVRKEKHIIKLNNIKNKLTDNRWADMWLLLACITPIPYTLTIYASSVLNYDRWKFVLINVVGRCIKYVSITALWLWGVSL